MVSRSTLVLLGGVFGALVFCGVLLGYLVWDGLQLGDVLKAAVATGLFAVLWTAASYNLLRR